VQPEATHTEKCITPICYHTKPNAYNKYAKLVCIFTKEKYIPVISTILSFVWYEIILSQIYIYINKNRKKQKSAEQTADFIRKAF